MEVDDEMEEESSATNDEDDDEDQMKEQPRKHETGVAAGDTDHKENVADEPTEVDDENNCQDGVGLLDVDQVPGASDDASVDQDEDENGGHSEQEIHDRETGSQHLDNIGTG